MLFKQRNMFIDLAISKNATNNNNNNNNNNITKNDDDVDNENDHNACIWNYK